MPAIMGQTPGPRAERASYNQASLPPRPPLLLLFCAGIRHDSPALLLLPRHLRAPVQIMHRFVQSARTIARAGGQEPQERLAALHEYEFELDRIATGTVPQAPLFRELASIVAQRHLPLAPFHSLLAACRDDAAQTTYADFGALMDYCRRAANPVGRLMLALVGDDNPRHQAYADALCTGLQFVQLLRRVGADFAQGRVYLPQDELRRHGILRQHLHGDFTTPLWETFMRAQIERARRLLQAGAPLGLALPGRAGFAVRMIVAGGERILRKLHAAPAAALGKPVRLGAWDGAVTLGRALARR